MDDNGEELSFEEMLTELSERGTAAMRERAVAVGKGAQPSGMTFGAPVTIPPGGESIEATARRFFGEGEAAMRQAGITPPVGAGIFGGLPQLPSWWPYAAVGLGAVGLWWYTTKKGK